MIEKAMPLAHTQRIDGRPGLQLCWVSRAKVSTCFAFYEGVAASKICMEKICGSMLYFNQQRQGSYCFNKDPAYHESFIHDAYQ